MREWRKGSLDIMARFRVRGMAADALHRMHVDYRRAARRLILLAGRPGCIRPGEELAGLLRALARQPGTEVVLAGARPSGGGHDFILAIGDGLAGEELFAWLPAAAWSVRVGAGASAARYFVSSLHQVAEVLRQLVSAGGDGSGPAWQKGLAFPGPSGPSVYF